MLLLSLEMYEDVPIGLERRKDRPDASDASGDAMAKEHGMGLEVEELEVCNNFKLQVLSLEESFRLEVSEKSLQHISSRFWPSRGSYTSSSRAKLTMHSA